MASGLTTAQRERIQKGGWYTPAEIAAIDAEPDGWYTRGWLMPEEQKEKAEFEAEMASSPMDAAMAQVHEILRQTWLENHKDKPELGR